MIDRQVRWPRHTAMPAATAINAGAPVEAAAMPARRCDRTELRIFATSPNSTCSANQTRRLAITPTTAAVIAASAPDRPCCPCSRSMKGAPRNIQRKHGTKVNQAVSTRRARPPARARTRRHRGRPEKADEHQHQDQRPGRRLGKAEPGQHLARRQPAIDLHRLLADIGQHRIGAAEGDDRRLGEERAPRRQKRPRTDEQSMPPAAPATAAIAQSRTPRDMPERLAHRRGRRASTSSACPLPARQSPADEPAPSRSPAETEACNTASADEGGNGHRRRFPTLERPLSHPHERLRARWPAPPPSARTAGLLLPGRCRNWRRRSTVQAAPRSRAARTACRQASPPHTPRFSHPA